MNRTKGKWNKAVRMTHSQLNHIMSLGVPLNKSVEQLVKESRTSTGFGLIFHHELARIEANFCVPLQFKTGDLAQAGLQFGLGLNFL